MISGGDSAMMSPVTRASRPFSNARTNTSKPRAPGLPGSVFEFDRADQPEVAQVDHVRQSLSECTASAQ